jgi:alkylation response protein AidB-like acyl-CoA dehydrogenase
MYRLTEEQQMLRDAVRVLADERIGPRAADIDKSAEFPWDVKDLLASHDILGLPFPAEYGGVGGDLLTICLAVEQISRVCGTSGLILAVQELGALPLLLAGSDEQKQRWFPDLAAGRTLIAFALTEAEAGSDPAATRPGARATAGSSTAPSGSSARAASPISSQSSPAPTTPPTPPGTSA